MKLTAQIRLKPSAAQANALLGTLEQINLACNYVSAKAFESETFNQYALHGLMYHEVKKKFGLGAQAVVRLLAKVSDAYDKDKKVLRVFKPRGAAAFDGRILTFKSDRSVSIWTVAGRQRIPYVCGERQAKMLEGRRGESDLVLRAGKWFLMATCDIAGAVPKPPVDYLGVDLGVVNIATDSDNNVYSGEVVEKVRKRNAGLRAGLQSRGTRSAKRHLKKMGNREARFRKDVNHRISKLLVARAEGTCRGLALENLKGIRERTTVGHKQRARQSGWSFGQLRAYVEYKAELAGIPVLLVGPRNTSRTCSVCGHCEKANRKSQSEFFCKHCGCSSHADLNAARNIRARALVNAPIVAPRHKAG